MTNKTKCPCGQDREACIDCTQPLLNEKVYEEAIKYTLLTGTAIISVNPGTTPPIVVLYKHPFLNTDQQD